MGVVVLSASRATSAGGTVRCCQHYRCSMFEALARRLLPAAVLVNVSWVCTWLYEPVGLCCTLSCRQKTTEPKLRCYRCSSAPRIRNRGRAYWCGSCLWLRHGENADEARRAHMQAMLSWLKCDTSLATLYFPFTMGRQASDILYFVHIYVVTPVTGPSCLKLNHVYVLVPCPCCAAIIATLAVPLLPRHL